jgi:hypothetical protein
VGKPLFRRAAGGGRRAFGVDEQVVVHVELECPEVSGILKGTSVGPPPRGPPSPPPQRRGHTTASMCEPLPARLPRRTVCARPARTRPSPCRRHFANVGARQEQRRHSQVWRQRHGHRSARPAETDVAGLRSSPVSDSARVSTERQRIRVRDVRHRVGKARSEAEPRGSLLEPCGSEAEPRGSLLEPCGSEAEPRGSLLEPCGSEVDPQRSMAGPRCSEAGPRRARAGPRRSGAELPRLDVAPARSVAAPTRSGAPAAAASAE